MSQELRQTKLRPGGDGNVLAEMFKSRNIDRAVLVLALSLILSSCQASDTSVPSLSDSDAIEVIEKHWASPPSWLLVGKLQVTRDGDDPQNQRISQSRAKEYAAWQEAGVISVTTTRDLTKQFTGWDDWMRLYGEGVQQVINVAPTERGLKIGHLEKTLFLYQPAKYRIKKIVRNVPIVKEFSEFRVILGTYSASFTPEVKAVYDKLGRSTVADRKFIILLWFDPFDSQWKAGAEDIASENVPFETENVHKYLASL